jgi:hypothetical protein
MLSKNEIVGSIESSPVRFEPFGHFVISSLIPSPDQNQQQQTTTMVASAVFITDLQGKAIISRNYRGDVHLTKAIEQFSKYLNEVEDEYKKPIFHVDPNGDISLGDDVGANGAGGEHFVYVAVSTGDTGGGISPFLFSNDACRRP